MSSRPRDPGRPSTHRQPPTLQRPFHQRVLLGILVGMENARRNHPRQAEQYTPGRRVAADAGKLARMAKTISRSIQSAISSRAATRHRSSAHPTLGLMQLPRSYRPPPPTCRLDSYPKLKRARRIHFGTKVAHSPRSGSYLGCYQERNRQ